MARPVIALLTDFGLSDHYVGVMKGVMLGICPDATFVDITHDIPAQDVAAAALELEASRRYFPARTVFLTVVDPGVGSARRAVAVERDGQLFVAPDNGLLTLAASDDEPWRGVELTERRYQRAEISRTFEGRDRFAPAAAWLASGVEIGKLGPSITGIVRIPISGITRQQGVISGRVIRIDRFGNLVTNIQAFELEGESRVVVDIGGREIAGISQTYADVAPGTLCALIGSTGLVEISVNRGSAAAMLAVGYNAPVRVRAGA